MDVATSINGISIRLTAERWQHISMGHPEIAGFYFEILETIEMPSAIYKGKFEELIAVKYFDKLFGKFVVVVYKDLSDKDGFVITAYLSNRINEFIKREKLWELRK